MKRRLLLIATGMFAIFAITDTVHDFFANDTIGYFAEKPERPALVAAIGVSGGMGVLLLEKWPFRTKQILGTKNAD